MVVATALAAMVGAVLVAGCGGSSSSASSGDGPIKIMQVIPLSGTDGAYEPWKNAAKASVAAINAKGGVNGRELQLVVCDTANNVNQTTACGRQAVSEGVIGIVDINPSGAYEPYVVPAHIASINQMEDPVEFKESNSFNLTSGTPGISAGLAALGKFLGCENTSLILAGSFPPAFSKSLTSAFTTTAKRVGMEASVVEAPAQVPDLSPFVADALRNGAQCLVLNALGPEFVSLFRAIEVSGQNVKLLTGTGEVAESTIHSLGPAVAKLHVLSNLLPASAKDVGKVSEWVETIKKYSDEPMAFESDSAAEWASVNLLAYAAEHVKKVDAADVLEYLESLHEYESGVGAPVSFDEPAASNPLGPRMFQQYALEVRFKQGQVEPYLASKRYFNIFTGEAGPSVR